MLSHEHTKTNIQDWSLDMEDLNTSDSSGVGA